MNTPVWTMKEIIFQNYPARYQISNGTFSFEVHVLIDGSIRREKYPDRWIIRPEEVKPLAEKILNALNKGWEP